MEDQLISFETAKLAKEKGFQLGSRKSYTHYHKSFTYDGDPNHPESHRKNDVRTDYDFYTVNNAGTPLDISNKHYTIYEAPTQSLLQRWLREKYNIDIVIKKHFNVYNVMEVTMYDSNEDLNVPFLKEDISWNDHSSYEEALEDSLQEILELIETK